MKKSSFRITRDVSRRDFLGMVATAGAGAALAGCSPLWITARPSLDLLIRNGTLIDGTGGAPRPGDLAIRNGKIVALEPLSTATAARTIEAKGLMVVPGFIDIHSHTDMDLLTNPYAQSKVHQGVTTEVTGQDGDSVAPLGGPGLEESLQRFRATYGYDCPYQDMRGFFTLLTSLGCAQNILSLVGLGTLRAVAVGFDNRPATTEEMDVMRAAAALAVDQGCFGASTGLEYTPGSFATADELAEVLAAIPPPYRLYATHMRNEDNRLLEAIQESIDISRKAGARLQVSHLKAQNKGNWPKQEQALHMLDQALASGLEVHADRYPYIAFNTGLSNLFPLWSRDGGNDKFLDRLNDTTLRERIKADVLAKVTGLGSWDAVMISAVKDEKLKKYQGKTLQVIAAEEHADPFELTLSLLLQEKGDVGMVGFGMDEAGTEMVLAWKNCMIASDAGPHSPGDGSWPHPRSYGTFPRAIGHYQRERKVTTLPDMIRKMTHLPAQKLGLLDRGVLEKGKAADVVVFDYDIISDRSTFTDPHEYPIGIPYVIVNGQLVVDENIQTKAKPGKVLTSDRSLS
jgi:N-acyl-D-amino-acid deacylase